MALALVVVGLLGEVAMSVTEDAVSTEIRYLLESTGVTTGSEQAVPAAFRIVSAAQDYAQPTMDRCCHTLTPLRIGQQTFKKGIGAHANGCITIELRQPMKRFMAFVGMDNNEDTQGTRGTAQFVVNVDGRERFRSPVCRCGEDPVSVEVDLAGALKLELIVNDAGDGINYDQADWADAILEAADGASYHVGDAFGKHLLSEWPTRFTYNGEICWKRFEAWQRTLTPPISEGNQTRYAIRWTEPETGFQATLHVTVFEKPAALDLQWEFANTGVEPSGLVEDLRSINVHGLSNQGQTTLHSCSGGLTGDFDQRSERTGFELVSTPLGQRTLSVNGGRSSNGDLPFFALTRFQGECNLVAGLGWSGQWRAEAKFDAQCNEVLFHAGMEPVHFRLRPGETARMPSALILPFVGALEDGQNHLRRVLHTHYQAKLNGQPVLPPVSFNSWFVFDNRVDAAMLCALADEAAPLGIEYFCLDSGWFDGDFPNGVGNWTIHRGKFPNGLKPVADHVHRLGMKFGLWFEPERVADGTRWQKEHPDLLLGRNLLDLGNPKGRELALSMLDSTISEVGVDWIRYDFNIDPLEPWCQAEGEEEKGLRQIRYINGLYEVLAELMRRHPGLLIEQCASGGRRIDLQTIRYGHTYWKSDDTYDQPLMRFHETGANHYLLGGHLNTNYCRYKSPGEVLALFGGPLGFGVDFRALTVDQKQFIKRTVAAYKSVRAFLNEDYYPLFPQTKRDGTWCGWEFVDPVRQEGFFAVYRPAASSYSAADVKLSGLHDQETYRVEDVMTGETRSVQGSELTAGIEVRLAHDTAKVFRFSR